MAYIDSRLASQRMANSPTPPVAGLTFVKASNIKMEEREEAKTQKQPAALGKLQEIDLGEEARSKNVQRTDMARRKMEGEEVEEVAVKPVKVRLGPNGRPWRSRKTTRGSDDVKRDMMVEDVLRESRRMFPFPLIVL